MNQAFARSLGVVMFLGLSLAVMPDAWAQCGSMNKAAVVSDANQDGVISKEEHSAAGGCPIAFSNLDKNKDGKLDAAEQVAMHSNTVEEAKQKGAAAIEKAGAEADSMLREGHKAINQAGEAK